MESQVLFRKITKTFQFLEVLVISALVFWSLMYTPTAVRITGEYLSKIVAYLCNHHVAFLIGNGIILWLFLLRRQKDVCGNHSDFANDYVEHSEVSSVSVSTTENEPILPETAVDDEGRRGGKYIEDSNNNSVNVRMVIEKATRQISRLQRMQSNKHKRETAVRSSENFRRSGGKKTSVMGAEIEMLSNEEFQRTVQAFIHKHRQSFLDQNLTDEMNQTLSIA